MSKITTNDGLARSGTGCFIPYGNSGRRQRINYTIVVNIVVLASLSLLSTALFAYQSSSASVYISIFQYILATFDSRHRYFYSIQIYSRRPRLKKRLRLQQRHNIGIAKPTDTLAKSMHKYLTKKPNRTF